MTMSGLAANRRPRVVAPRSPRIIYQWIARVPGRLDLTRKLLSGTRLIEFFILLTRTQGAHNLPKKLSLPCEIMLSTLLKQVCSRRQAKLGN